MRTLAVAFAAAIALAAAAQITVVQYPLPLNQGGVVVAVATGATITVTALVTSPGSNSSGQASDIAYCEALVGRVSAWGGEGWETDSSAGLGYQRMSYQSDSKDLKSDLWAVKVTQRIGLYEVGTHCVSTSGVDTWGTVWENGRFIIGNVTVAQWPLPVNQGGKVEHANISAGISVSIVVTTPRTAYEGDGSGMTCQALVAKVCQWGGGCWDQSLPGLGYIKLAYVGDTSDGLSDTWGATVYPPAPGFYEVRMHCWDDGGDHWATTDDVNGRFMVDGCGDKIVQEGEECDTGAAAVYGCRSDCTCEYGHVASSAGEWYGCRLHVELPEEPANLWRHRTIYQVVTDRFATTLATHENPCDTAAADYCGGTFMGIVRKLAYIKDMGFDAIWISPVVANTPKGYHGYWAQDFSTINTNFGSLADLQHLVTQCHLHGMVVMLDWVSNHVGPVGYNYSMIAPFNSSSDYHDCSVCQPGCSIVNNDYQVENEHCRLSGLPDLDTESSDVRKNLEHYARTIVRESGVDGLRLDSVAHVGLKFWEAFRETVNVFMMGEVADSTTQRLAVYQSPIDSMLWYPMYYAMRNAFAYQQSMTQLGSTLLQARLSFRDSSVLGRFVDNHDNKRFLNEQSDEVLYRNALTYTILGEGIPIVYYGSEQGLKGGADPANREALWDYGYQETRISAFIANLIATRKTNRVWLHAEIETISSDSIRGFSRGDLVVFVRNDGKEAVAQSIMITLPGTFHTGHYSDILGSKLQQVKLVAGRKTTLKLPAGGEPVILCRVA